MSKVQTTCAKAAGHAERSRSLKVALVTLGLLCVAGAVAADELPLPPALEALCSKMEAKAGQGKNTEADFADELKALDAMLTRHTGEKTEDVAWMLFIKARMYDSVLTNQDMVLTNKAKAEAIDAQLKRDFPNFGGPKLKVEDLIDLKSLGKQILFASNGLDKEAKALKIQAALKPGAGFSDFTEQDIAGHALSIAQYKGKVVLLDFWATWCMPCVRELPNVLKAYEAHHQQGFEVIGISLDDDPQKLAAFTKEKHLPWPQYCDGLGWHNKLAVKYGVTSIPATYLLDAQGTIIAKDLRGEELERAVAEALAKSQ